MSSLPERGTAPRPAPVRAWLAPWHRLRRWLQDVPVDHPVDRRNAPMLQVLLVFFGTALPLNWAWHLSDRPIPEGWGIVVALDMVTAVVALACAVLIRRGVFRPATRLFVGALLVTQAVVYHKLGTYAQLDQTALVLILVVSGLVLGRRTLWTTYGLIQVIFVIGWITDSRNPAATARWLHEVLKNAPSLLLSTGIIAYVIDRTAEALRGSLEESDARGRALEAEIARRERAQSQLIHAQKLEATGRLASGIAHDFDNVLDLVLGFARQRHAHDDAGNAERAAALEEALAGVEAAAGRGVVLTRKLLGFCRNDMLRIETFDAGQALLELQPMLRQLFPPSVRLHIHAEGAAPVRLDRGEFELMVLNVATNARDAMPDGGVFTVGLARLPGGAVAITLADTGHGMDARTMQRIFEPFFTTKDAGVGTGLGLAVIRDLVLIAGGDITADSTPGGGTTFTIRLPAGDADAEDGAAGQALNT
jgi:signal transduction histidine kinase